MTRRDVLRELLAGHDNAVQHFAQLGALLTTVFDLTSSGGATAPEAADVVHDALTVYAATQRTARRAARLVVSAGVPAVTPPACPCGSTNTRLRRFAGEGPPLCAGCYQRRWRAAG